MILLMMIISLNRSKRKPQLERQPHPSEIEENPEIEDNPELIYPQPEPSESTSQPVQPSQSSIGTSRTKLPQPRRLDD